MPLVLAFPDGDDRVSYILQVHSFSQAGSAKGIDCGLPSALGISGEMHAMFYLPR